MLGLKMFSDHSYKNNHMMVNCYKTLFNKIYNSHCNDYRKQYILEAKLL